MKDKTYSSKLWEHRNCDIEITYYKNPAVGIIALVEREQIKRDRGEE